MNPLQSPPPLVTPPTPHSISFSFAKRHQILLNEYHNGIAHVYYTDNTPVVIISEIRRYLEQNQLTALKLDCLDEEKFNALLQLHYEAKNNPSEQMMAGLEDDLNLFEVAKQLSNEPQDLLENVDDAPIIRLINALLAEAIKENASDIHIEPFESRLLVRFRIDGVLREVLQPQRALAPLLASRIKVMAKLDIAEKRLPQDGRISLRVAGRAVDVRVSTIPSVQGERVVMRLLDKQARQLELGNLGLTTTALQNLKTQLGKPHGIILVTGPTGAGKTTSLYAMLNELNDNSRNIMTIEDPIEYYIDGIGQTQVNSKIDMTFSRGLRAILRQDPDVVMVGEIRDEETARIAIQSSLTGHLVLSTLHTNTAIGAITRLADMGIEHFLLSASVVAVISQRLLRKLCDCKQAKTMTATEAKQLQQTEHSQKVIYHPVGCPECNNTGYKGRLGIYELIDIDETLASMIHDNQNQQTLQKYAEQQSPRLFADGIRQVLAGQTSYEELTRVIR